MTDPDLVTALTPFLRVLDGLGVRYFIGGSIASSAHGVARASVDGDVVAELGASHVAPIMSALGDRYYVSEERARDAVARKASFNIIHLDTMLKIDGLRPPHEDPIAMMSTTIQFLFIVAVPVVLVVGGLVTLSALGALFDALDHPAEIGPRIDALFRRPPKAPRPPAKDHYYRAYAKP